MKRFALIGLIFLALVVAVPAGAHAQSDKDQQASGNPVTSSGDSTGDKSSSNTVSQDSLATKDGNGAGAGLNGDPSHAFGWLLGGIMALFAWLAGTAGILLNDAVYYTVVAMGTIVNPNNLSAIGVAWRILRDLGNIVLIFGFIAIGIATIVGYDSYGVGKRLPTLLIVAVFINFSLFATEAVIDVGNLFATQFYTQINNGQPPAPQALSSIASNSPISGGISGTVMNAIGLQALYQVNGDQSGNALPESGSGGASITDTKVMLTGMLASILFLVLAFVLFSLTIILVTRFIALVFVMIVAPIGFAGLIIPGLEGTAKSWWKTLFEQVVTAPALLLMLYVALAVITDKNFVAGFLGGNSSAGAAAAYTAVAGGASDTASLTAYAGVLLSFVIAMGLLMACVIMAKKMGAFGASFATKTASWATFGATSYLLRNTVGRTSNYIGRGVRRVLPNEVGRVISKPFDLGGKASFDLRATKLGKAIDVDFGKGQKGGYVKEVEEKKKAQLDYAKSLQGTRTWEQEQQIKAAKETLEKAQDKKNKDETARDKAQSSLDAAKTKLESMNAMEPGYAAAEKQVTDATARLTEAENALAASTTGLTDAQKDKEEADKIEDSTTSTKEVQAAYAQGLRGGWSRAGAGAGAGGAVGTVIGALGGPLGMVVGTHLGAAIGAGLGAWKGTGFRNSAADQSSRELLRKMNQTPVERAAEELASAVDKASKKTDSGSDEKKPE